MSISLVGNINEETCGHIVELRKNIFKIKMHRSQSSKLQEHKSKEPDNHRSHSFAAKVA